MHAEHRNHFDEAYGMYDGDPTRPGGGFSKLVEYFPGVDHGWQIFFGSDMSGATLHWHEAAFNILYVGTKEWHVTPPLYRGFTGTPAEVALERFANQPFGVRCTQLPGDLIYTRSLGTFDAESRVRDRRGEHREAASEGCAGGCLTKKVGWNA